MRFLPLVVFRRATVYLLSITVGILLASNLRASAPDNPASSEPPEQAVLRSGALKALRSGDAEGATRALETLGALRHSQRHSRGSADALVLQAIAQAAVALHAERSPALGLALSLHSQRLAKAQFASAAERAAALQAQALLTERLWGDRGSAKSLYQKVLESDPSHRGAQAALLRIAAAEEAEARWSEDNQLARIQGKAAQ